MSGYLELVGMGVEHDIMCIDFFGVVICSTGDTLWLYEYMPDRMRIEIEEHQGYQM